MGPRVNSNVKTKEPTQDSIEILATMYEARAQLLAAEEKLHSHHAMYFALQNEVLESRQRLRELEGRLAERRRYAPLEFPSGDVALRDTSAVPPEPHRHFCRPCFDKGPNGVMKRRYAQGI